MKFDNFYKSRLVEDAAKEIASMELPPKVLFEAYITYNNPDMLNKWLIEAENIEKLPELKTMIRTPDKRPNRIPSPHDDFSYKYWNAYELLLQTMTSLTDEAKRNNINSNEDIISLYNALRKITDWMSSNSEKVSKVYKQIKSNVSARLQPMRLSQESPVAQSEVGG